MTASQRNAATEARFDALYTAAFDDVLRFVYRRIGPEDALARAENITQETFTAAWRRLDSVPTDQGDAKAWLYTVARSLILRERRGNQRRAALAIKLADDALVSSNHADSHLVTASPHEEVATRLDVAAAWATLRAADQEVLALAVWEDLPAVQAGKVLGISAMAYRTRLTRARAALRQAITATNTNAQLRAARPQLLEKLEQPEYLEPLTHPGQPITNPLAPQLSKSGVNHGN